MPATTTANGRVQFIVSGDSHICAISGCNVLSWGTNKSGELGREVTYISAPTVQLGRPHITQREVGNATDFLASMRTELHARKSPQLDSCVHDTVSSAFVPMRVALPSLSEVDND